MSVTDRQMIWRERVITAVILVGALGMYVTLTQLLRPATFVNRGSGTSSVQVVVHDLTVYEQTGPDAGALDRQAMWYVRALLAADFVLAIVYGLLLGWFMSLLWRPTPATGDAGQPPALAPPR